MTDNRSAFAAHEALNRMADDIIAGRIGPAPTAAKQPEPPHPADPAAPAYQPEHYAEAQPEQADPYAHQAYTPEQQAAADAYAAQFAASIAETAVASATHHQASQQPVTMHYDPVPAPEVATAAVEPPPYAPAPSPAAIPAAAVAAAAAAAPAVTVVKQGSSVLTYFAAILAMLALLISAYQGYVFNRSIDMMERNAARSDFVRACRDMVGSYYEVKKKISVLMPAADRGNIVGASRVTESNRLEGQAAITKFGNLSNYLASFQDVSARVQYNELTKTLNGILDVARTTPLTDLERVFAPADKLFTGMSDDCGNPARVLRK